MLFTALALAGQEQEPPPRKRILLPNAEIQKQLAENNLAKSSKATEKVYISAFLLFVGDTSGQIKREYLTDAICTSDIAAVWSTEPFVSPSTIRGTQTHIFS